MFEQNNRTILATSDARKETISGEKAWDLISSFDRIVAGKGKKVVQFNPGLGDKDDILKVCLGRTGNLRAPAVKSGNTLYVGFNQDLYQDMT